MKTLTVIQLVANAKMSSKITDLLKFVRKQRIYNYFEFETTLNSTLFSCIIFLLLHYPLWHDIPRHKKFYLGFSQYYLQTEYNQLNLVKTTNF